MDYNPFKPEVKYLYFTGVNCPPCHNPRTKKALEDMQKKEKVEVYSDGSKNDLKVFKTYNVGAIPFLIKLRDGKEVGRENFISTNVDGSLTYGGGYDILKDK